MRWRRVGLGALTIVVAVALVGLGLWRWWWPHHRPDLREGERYGIDVSNHQGDIDWESVAADGIDVAYLKATEGGDHTDARFAESWRAARAAGLEVGAYHFFTLCRPGAEQAANFLRTVPDGADLPPALDLEMQGNCSARPPADEVRAEVEVFLDLVEEATGAPAVIYVLDSWEDRYPTRELAVDGRRVWHRRIGPLRPDGDWWLWQLSDRARVDGIEGPVDLNVVRQPPD